MKLINLFILLIFFITSCNENYKLKKEYLLKNDKIFVSKINKINDTILSDPNFFVMVDKNIIQSISENGIDCKIILTDRYNETVNSFTNIENYFYSNSEFFYYASSDNKTVIYYNTKYDDFFRRTIKIEYQTFPQLYFEKNITYSDINWWGGYIQGYIMNDYYLKTFIQQDDIIDQFSFAQKFSEYKPIILNNKLKKDIELCRTVASNIKIDPYRNTLKTILFL